LPISSGAQDERLVGDFVEGSDDLGLELGLDGGERERVLHVVVEIPKRSYATAEAAEMAGMVIKKGHPIVRVSVYDSVETANKIIELPAGSSPKS
jgi:hypothetical protein